MIRHAAALLAAFILIAAIPRAGGTPSPKAAASPAQLVPAVSNPVALPPPKPVPPPNAAPASFDLGVWTVHASSLDANFKTGDFSTPNKIVMTRTGGDVSADRANGNYKKKTLYLNGNVVMHDAQGGAGGVGGEPSGSQRSGGPSTLTADRAQIDGDAKVYKAIGNVHYVQGETTVTADTGTLNDTDHTLFLQGSVHIVSGTRNMSAQTVRYNTTTGNAHAQGNVTMQFPSEFHRHLATPKPLNLPKHGLLAPPSSSP
jgi:lipopolysaccharide assembly outer membrane protein LptD (OstA)